MQEEPGPFSSSDANHSFYQDSTESTKNLIHEIKSNLKTLKNVCEVLNFQINTLEKKHCNEGNLWPKHLDLD